MPQGGGGAQGVFVFVRRFFGREEAVCSLCGPFWKASFTFPSCARLGDGVRQIIWYHRV